jgi:hypothetical protein
LLRQAGKNTGLPRKDYGLSNPSRWILNNLTELYSPFYGKKSSIMYNENCKQVRKVHMLRKRIVFWIILAPLLAACVYPNQSGSLIPVTGGDPSAARPATAPPPFKEDTQLGPDAFPPDVNPLTGLKVENPKNLLVPPAMVSITNFPVSARPQAGLSFSPIVFELYVGEGATRFLAFFYGDYPQVALEDGRPIMSVVEDAMIGPIRSGRLPYESLRKLFNGFLVMASAYKGVAANLSSVSNIFGSDADDINSAMINVTQLEEIAKANQKDLGAASLTGMHFDAAIPEGGRPGQTVKIPYSLLNQVAWQYNKADGSYHRWQDNADGKTFAEATDRLNGDPLTFENVIILFANHHAWAETLIDVDLMYIYPSPALLFRDGHMYKIRWTTKSEEYEKTTGKLRPIRFIDENGDPFPLKPGQTWISIIPSFTRYYETVESEVLFDILNKKQPGSGEWVVRFFPPVIEEKP